MALRVAINGFGRIGRLVLRSIAEHGRTDIEVVAINDLGPVETNAHLLRYDSVHGRFPGKITAANGHLKADGHDMQVISEANPEKLPWRDLGVDIPGEVSVVGFDDLDVARICTPPLTTIRFDSEGLGAAAFEVLHDRLQGRRQTICRNSRRL